MTPRIVLWSMVTIVTVAVIYFAKPAHAWEGTVGMIVGTEIGEGNTGVYIENLQEGGYRIVFISNTDNDPRVTRVGRFLRRSALDELPEVLSIWKGDMSLVGPRALEVEEHRLFEEQIPEFATRLQVRPGLTGLAQVYDRADNPLDKFSYDLEYLHRMSPWLDISILALSVRNTLAARWDQRQGKPAGVDVEGFSLSSHNQDDNG